MQPLQAHHHVLDSGQLSSSIIQTLQIFFDIWSIQSFVDKFAKPWSLIRGLIYGFTHGIDFVCRLVPDHPDITLLFQCRGLNS